ncbi:MAG: arginine--tRNA ligase [Bacteroidales bacterium]|nr:arginine--tRNA ligase [Candidatus Scybalousia scybalohippi]
MSFLFFCIFAENNFLKMIQQLLQQSIAEALNALYGMDMVAKDVALQPTKKEFEGDYTLVVFPYVKLAKKRPEEVAQEIGEKVQSLSELVTGFNIIKGFLNFSVSKNYWNGFLDKNKCNSSFGYKETCTENPIVIEYSSPNTNKPLHLGHIRNNLLGWSVAEILKANGRNVKKVNLVNDRGVHICKSMVAWKRFSNGETPENSGMKGDHLVGKYYVVFDKEYKKEIADLVAQGMDEETAKKEAPIMKEAQEMLVKWEAKDAEVRALWEKMNSWVYEGFDKTYKRLGIDFDKIYYESQTYLLGKNLVQEGLDKGVFYKREDGSVWIDLTSEGLDEKLLLRKDGTSVYMTQDLGTACLRHEDFSSNHLVYVVGNEQIYHFQVLKKVMEKLGFEWAKDLYHLSYGMVELPNGKMKSREGTVVDADDLMEDMYQEAKAQTESHGKHQDFSQEEADKLYNTLALGALKYFMLKVDPTKTMLFNPKESIDFNGNTGPFIQYTYARICSIIRKAKEEKGVDVANTRISMEIELTEKEIDVLKTISSYSDVIREAGRTYSPSLIANFAYSLAKQFNAFYQDCSILREENEDIMKQRVCLAYFTGEIIKSAMHLLGIDVPQRM